MIYRDKLIGGATFVLATWLATFWAFRVEAAPIVKLLLTGYAVISTAVIGGALL